MKLYTNKHRNLMDMLYSNDELIESIHLTLENFDNFFVNKIALHAKRIDEGIFPKENLEKLAELGFFGISYPEEYGGFNLPYPVYICALEMLADACANTALTVAIHDTCCNGLLKYGSIYLKEKYLIPAVKGNKLGAFALTESDAGSDAAAIKTSAKEEDNMYILNGAKRFITNSGNADFYVVFAKINEQINAFVVENNAEGLSFGKKEEKICVRGTENREIFFDNCKIAKENLLGENGFKIAMNMLNSGRITIAAFCTGIAEAAYQKALRYSGERKSFGKYINQHQMIQEKIANMRTNIDAARTLTYHAAWLKDKKREYIEEAAEAKLFASEMAIKICLEAIQIHGGYGLTDEYDMPRYLRDALLGTIGEGTSEILRMTIAKNEIKKGK